MCHDYCRVSSTDEQPQEPNDDTEEGILTIYQLAWYSDRSEPRRRKALADMKEK